MIRRRVVIAFMVIVVAVVSIAAWVGRNSNMLRDIDTADIEEIRFLNNEYVTITEQDDIQILFKELQSMKFKKLLNYHKYGSGLLIDITLKSGETFSLTILSDNIIINGQNYKPDKDYRDNIKNIFNTLAVA